MDSLEFWRNLRVLVSNVCNYKCTFCHNEGQSRTYEKVKFLSFDNYKLILDSLNGSMLKEIHFSGGEPFINHDTIRMIEYTCINTEYDVGCATNLYMLTEDDINRLSGTRVKLNIQFPSANKSEFIKITGRNSWDKIHYNIELLKKYNIHFGLNNVIQVDHQDSFLSCLNYGLKNGISIKFLPEVVPGKSDCAEIKKKVFPLLDSMCHIKNDKNTGAIVWQIKNQEGVDVQIMYIDSPCFYLDFNKCRNYAEIRLHPDLKIQSCLMPPNNSGKKYQINLEHQDDIMNKFKLLWKNFTNC